jgi:hypothetical protein
MLHVAGPWTVGIGGIWGLNTAGAVLLVHDDKQRLG